MLRAAIAPFEVKSQAIWLFPTPLYPSKSKLLVIFGLVYLVLLFLSELSVNIIQLPRATYRVLTVFI